MPNHTQLLSEAFRSLDEYKNRLIKLNNWEAAVNKFRAVCADIEGVNFQRHSPYEIEAAAKYIAFGFERDLALQYAIDYGMDGLHLIQQLQDDFKFDLLKLH